MGEEGALEEEVKYEIQAFDQLFLDSRHFNNTSTEINNSIGIAAAMPGY